MPRHGGTQRPDIDVRWTSDRSLRLALRRPEAPDHPDHPDLTARRLAHAADALRQADVPGLIDAVSTGSSILLTFDVLTAHDRALDIERYAVGFATDALSTPPAQQLSTSAHERLIPVCYDPRVAPDLDELADLTGLAVDTIIEQHANSTYTVDCIGFSPGFAYMVGLDRRLRVPRRPEPRVRIPAGSVAIAGPYTGIYPQATPGGWHVVGQTPLTMFDVRRERPSLLAAGDRVRFERIDYDRFCALRDSVDGAPRA